MSTCKGCGKSIVWATTPQGRRIPLDANTPTYTVTVFPENTPAIAERSAAMVSHFVTCPKANDFSGSRKK